MLPVGFARTCKFCIKNNCTDRIFINNKFNTFIHLHNGTAFAAKKITGQLFRQFFQPIVWIRRASYEQ